MYYDILTGKFQDENERLMQISDMVKKLTWDYAEMHLGVRNEKEKLVPRWKPRFADVETIVRYAAAWR